MPVDVDDALVNALSVFMDEIRADAVRNAEAEARAVSVLFDEAYGSGDDVVVALELRAEDTLRVERLLFVDELDCNALCVTVWVAAEDFVALGDAVTVVEGDARPVGRMLLLLLRVSPAEREKDADAEAEREDDADLVGAEEREEEPLTVPTEDVDAERVEL